MPSKQAGPTRHGECGCGDWETHGSSYHQNKSWGGARAGSGNSPKSPVATKLAEEQKQKYQRLGGALWVREKIDKAKEQDR